MTPASSPRQREVVVDVGVGPEESVLGYQGVTGLHDESVVDTVPEDSVADIRDRF